MNLIGWGAIVAIFAVAYAGWQASEHRSWSKPKPAGDVARTDPSTQPAQRQDPTSQPTATPTVVERPQIESQPSSPTRPRALAAGDAVVLSRPGKPDAVVYVIPSIALYEKYDRASVDSVDRSKTEDARTNAHLSRLAVEAGSPFVQPRSTGAVVSVVGERIEVRLASGVTGFVPAQFVHPPDPPSGDLVRVGADEVGPLPSFSESAALRITPSKDVDGRVTVTGTTNLPDGTELMVDIAQTDGTKKYQAKSSVRTGAFKAGPFGPTTGMPSGSYRANVLVVFASAQSDAVRAVIGQQGERLRGPLVRREPDDDEPMVEATRAFTIGVNRAR